MATLQLLASAYTRTATSVSVTNPANAYTDTTSTTYAAVGANSSGAGLAYFGGFDFTQIPSGATNITMTFKVKVKSSTSSNRYYVGLYNASTGDALSATTQTTTTATTYTLTLSSLSFADVIALGNNFAFGFSKYSTSQTQSVYGMEVNVTYNVEPRKNKVIYNGNTLIDLTGDTVTAEDVASGILFHLANGEQAIGTASAEAKFDFVTSANSSTSQIHFTGLQGEPSAFMIMPYSAIQFSSTAVVNTNTVTYNGTIVYGTTYTTGASTNNGIKVVTTSGAFSFSYSNGTLTVSTPSSRSTYAYMLLIVYSSIIDD